MSVKLLTRRLAAYLTATVFFFASSAGWAVDLSYVLNRVHARYERFDRDVPGMTASMTVRGNDGSMIRIRQYRRGGFVRIDTENPSAELVQNQDQAAERRGTVIFDGHTAWAVTASGAQETDATLLTEIPMYGPWWKLLSDGAQIIDQMRLGPVDCFVIQLESSPGSWYSKLWVDKDSLVLVRVEGATGNGRQLALEFSDFRQVSGWKMPFRTDHYEDGILLRNFVVKSLKLNAELPDEVFRIPEPRIRAGAAKPPV